MNKRDKEAFQRIRTQKAKEIIKVITRNQWIRIKTTLKYYFPIVFYRLHLSILNVGEDMQTRENV